MEYILSDKEGQACPFCQHASCSEREMQQAHVLVVTDHAFVVLNRYPFASGHLLVVPARHVANLQDLADAEYDALFRLVRDAAVRLSRALCCDGSNIGINLGRVAGAGLAAHLHVHVVPRWDGDTNFMPVIADVRVMPQYLAATFGELHPHFADIPGRHAPAPERGSR
jgi:ATP adenylyltransferase